MTNKKSVGKIMTIAGIIMTLVGLALTQVHIPLTREESQALFQYCIECKLPPTYHNFDPNITEGLFFAGFPVIGVGLFLRYAI